MLIRDYNEHFDQLYLCSQRIEAKKKHKLQQISFGFIYYLNFVTHTVMITGFSKCRLGSPCKTYIHHV